MYIVKNMKDDLYCETQGGNSYSKKTLTLEPSTAHRTYGPGPTPVQNAADKGYDNDILNIFKPSF